MYIVMLTWGFTGLAFRRVNPQTAVDAILHVRVFDAWFFDGDC